MAFVSAFYIMFNIKERVCKSKHLQFIAGVNVVMFWLPSYICDTILFTLTSLCTVFTVYVFQQEGFSTLSDIGKYKAPPERKRKKTGVSKDSFFKAPSV